MKKLLRCPKCAGRRIWILERFRIPSDVAEGRELPLVPHQQVGPRSANLLSFGRVNPVGHVDLHVCDGCGYAELWAESFRGLVEDPSRGIRLVDTSSGEGPFR